jgi:hypothetical protein
MKIAINWERECKELLRKCYPITWKEELFKIECRAIDDSSQLRLAIQRLRRKTGRKKKAGRG